MEEDKVVVDQNKEKNCCKSKQNMCGPAQAVYGLGFIGAIIYFIQHANTFWMGVVGVLKAIVWPAFLVYKFLEFFKF